MKLKKVLFISIGLFAAGCSNIDNPDVPKQEVSKPELTIEEAQVASHLTDFCFDFIAEASKETGDENMIVSPFGVASVLSMVGNVTDETTRTQITNLLGEENIEACNSLMLKYMSWLPYADAKVDLAIANSVWYSSRYALNAEFARIAEEYYMSDQFCRDFASSAICGEINAWCSKKTRGLIPEFIKEINPMTAAILLNALYFKGEWTTPFTVSATHKAPFNGLHHSNVVDMMKKDLTTAYNETADCKGVWLSYGKSKYSMLCILPNEGTTVDDVLASGALKEIFNRQVRTEVELNLPKFKIAPEENLDLENILSNLGCKNLFSPQISSIFTVPVEVKCEAKQRAYIEVDEEGTKAAAVTGIGVVETALPIPAQKVQLTFDRPFLFLILENTTGITLFAGKVVDL